MQKLLCALGILITLSSVSVRAAVVVAQRYRWPNATIPYEFQSLSPKEVELVQKAIDRWHTATSIHLFRPKQAGDKHFVAFVPAQNLSPGVCMASRAGFDVNTTILDVQVQMSCELKIIVHELGHVIGLEHEHQRCDAGSYVQVTYGTWVELAIREQQAQAAGRHSIFPSQFNLFSCIPEMNRGGAASLFARYDFMSVMHYDPILPLCLASACQAFVLTDQAKKNFFVPDQRTPDQFWRDLRNDLDCKLDTSCISSLDVAAVRQMYGFQN